MRSLYAISVDLRSKPRATREWSLYHYVPGYEEGRKESALVAAAYSLLSRIFYVENLQIRLLQWNFTNPDTLGTEESVLISEMS